jgi:hypothetical protein
MKTSFRQLVVHVLFLVALIGSSSQAQEPVPADQSPSPPSTSRHNDGAMMISLIGGHGVASPAVFMNQSGKTVYTTTRRPFIFELELSRTMKRSEGEKFFSEYFIAAQPLISAGGNIRYNDKPCLDTACKHVDLNVQRYSSFGFGLMPFGVRLMGVLPGDMRLGMSLGAGAIYFSKAVPYEEATHFNFHLVVNPTLGFRFGNSGRLWTGYEFVHLSNAGTGKTNPGINAGLFKIGFQRGGT